MDPEPIPEPLGVLLCSENRISVLIREGKINPVVSSPTLTCFKAFVFKPRFNGLLHIDPSVSFVQLRFDR